jgi:hypothetical protein
MLTYFLSTFFPLSVSALVLPPFHVSRLFLHPSFPLLFTLARSLFISFILRSTFSSNFPSFFIYNFFSSPLFCSILPFSTSFRSITSLVIYFTFSSLVLHICFLLRSYFLCHGGTYFYLYSQCAFHIPLYFQLSIA